MKSRIAKWRIGYARLDYVRPVHWAAHSETYGDAIVLELVTSDGLCGSAEAIMRPKWHDTTPAELKNILVQGLLPALKQFDWTDEQALSACLTRFRRYGFACALVDQAIWDLSAQMAGQPLWRLLGARHSRVPVSFTLTRTQPEIMAREAADMREKYGFTAFKVKTGQGVEIDRRAIADIRKSVGDDVTIMADSNRAHLVEDVAAMSAMLAESGVVWFEDPCAFTADASFLDAQTKSKLPILVDNQCRSLETARKFIALGARALSVKTMKTGITESREIVALARSHDVKLAAGISASGGAGAIHTLSLAASLPPGSICLACEETFFLYLKRDILKAPLQVIDGAVDLSGMNSVAGAIDWARMDSESHG